MKHFAASFVLLCPLVAFSAEIADAKFFRVEAHLKKIQAIAANAGVSHTIWN